MSLLDELRAEVRGMMRGDPAHDYGHVERVCRNAEAICRAEGADPRLVLCAALLHDVVSYPKSDPRSGDAPGESAAVARRVLARLGMNGADIDVVAGAVRDHGYSRGAVPSTETGRILQDADRLDAVGAIGIARAFATGGAEGRPLYRPGDPFCTSREPDDGAWTLDHFYSKLLRLERLMNTGAGRAEARRRSGTLRRYLDELGREIQP